MIPDRFFYPLAALVVAALVYVALLWPIGQGAPQPRLFKTPPAKIAAK